MWQILKPDFPLGPKEELLISQDRGGVRNTIKEKAKISKWNAT